MYNDNNFYHRHITCVNCMKKGHLYNKCPYPITSYGIIAFKKFIINGKFVYKFLLIQRRNTIGYVDIIRSKYKNKDIMNKVCIEEMALIEKKKIIASKSFDDIWTDLWINKESRIYKLEYQHAKSNYENNNIKDMILSTINETKWADTEFTFPKGRRNNRESILSCALREFTEETGIDKKHINLINPTYVINEQFIGSNGIFYKHSYFLAQIDIDELPYINDSNSIQFEEIKYINWFTFKEAVNIFRNYSPTTRHILYQIHSFLQNSI